MVTEEKKAIVYHQILEAVRWYARNDDSNILEVLNNIGDDIMDGVYERKELDKTLMFWESV